MNRCCSYAATNCQGPGCLNELKLDGYRALVIESGGKLQLRSRNDNDFSARYPGILKALEPMPDETVVDGEVVALATMQSITKVNSTESLCIRYSPPYIPPVDDVYYKSE